MARDSSQMEQEGGAVHGTPWYVILVAAVLTTTLETGRLHCESSF